MAFIFLMHMLHDLMLQLNIALDSTEHTMQSLFSMFGCSLIKTSAWDICEGRTWPACLHVEISLELMTHPSLQDQDCKLSAGVRLFLATVYALLPLQDFNCC